MIDRRIVGGCCLLPLVASRCCLLRRWDTGILHRFFVIGTSVPELDSSATASASTSANTCHRFHRGGSAEIIYCRFSSRRTSVGIVCRHPLPHAVRIVCGARRSLYSLHGSICFFCRLDLFWSIPAQQLVAPAHSLG
jgi:hypothetical protein